MPADALEVLIIMVACAFVTIAVSIYCHWYERRAVRRLQEAFKKLPPASSQPSSGLAKSDDPQHALQHAMKACVTAADKGMPLSPQGALVTYVDGKSRCDYNPEPLVSVDGKKVRRTCDIEVDLKGSPLEAEIKDEPRDPYRQRHGGPIGTLCEERPMSSAELEAHIHGHRAHVAEVTAASDAAEKMIYETAKKTYLASLHEGGGFIGGKVTAEIDRLACEYARQMVERNRENKRTQIEQQPSLGVKDHFKWSDPSPKD